MNILVDTLPQTVEIDGIEYPINTDFRACLRIMLAFEDNELTSSEKQYVLLANLYPEMPHDIEQAFEKAGWFLDGGDERKTDDEEDDDYAPRLFAFGHDHKLIFAAFRQTHGIDLQKAQLHWWEFIALLMDLGGDTTFCQLTALRKRVATGKATKEERKLADEMGDVFKLPEVDNRTLEERDIQERFLKLAEKGMRARALRKSQQK